MTEATVGPLNEELETLYRDLLDAWNRRDVAGFAELFAPGGHAVGFDGSEMDGPEEIRSSLEGIFGDHQTVAVRRDGAWHIVLWHNTPAAFHGRPEAREALKDGLRVLIPR
jgi:hypothetical protein